MRAALPANSLALIGQMRHSSIHYFLIIIEVALRFVHTKVRRARVRELPPARPCPKKRRGRAGKERHCV